jgi:hypothetical protein
MDVAMAQTEDRCSMNGSCRKVFRDYSVWPSIQGRRHNRDGIHDFVALDSRRSASAF